MGVCPKIFWPIIKLNFCCNKTKINLNWYICANTTKLVKNFAAIKSECQCNIHKEGRWVGLQTLWWFRFKDLSIDEMVGAWCFGCCQAHRGLPVGFLLLHRIQFYILYCLLSPYLCFISFLYLDFVCFWSPDLCTFTYLYVFGDDALIS